ncbi:MAG: F0F1 ATP synthase subunit gamma, partial [Planctomycetaceae bacterium]|nr:F0F1 ATP synthase subunit gamma [Planctomycetaceae bacterium]
VTHPLLEEHAEKKSGALLVLTANRGLCGGYNGNVIRMGTKRRKEMMSEIPQISLDVSGKRGISGFKFREIEMNEQFLQFDDQPAYQDVEQIANAYLQRYVAGELDRLDVVYTQFHSIARQTAVVETLLPMGTLDGAPDEKPGDKKQSESVYEFEPSAESILEEVVPTS